VEFNQAIVLLPINQFILVDHTSYVNATKWISYINYSYSSLESYMQFKLAIKTDDKRQKFVTIFVSYSDSTEV
jgi:hypothetical protein